MKTLVLSNGDTRGFLVTPRNMSLEQGIKFSSNVNDAAIDLAALELPLATPRDSRYCRTGEGESLSKAVPEIVKSATQPCLCCKV